MVAKYKRNTQSAVERNPQAQQITAKGFFIVMNDKGLHTRPSTELVKCTTSFKSHVNLIYQGFVVNGKSLLGILTLSAGKGARIEIEAVGEDAEKVVAALIELSHKKFYTHY
jgi:phosphocarrier protein HPr